MIRTTLQKEQYALRYSTTPALQLTIALHVVFCHTGSHCSESNRSATRKNEKSEIKFIDKRDIEMRYPCLNDDEIHSQTRPKAYSKIVKNNCSFALQQRVRKYQHLP